MPILKKLKARFLSWLKKSSLPELFRFVNRRKFAYDDAITRARSLTKLLNVSSATLESVSASGGIDVSGGGTGLRAKPGSKPSGGKADSGIIRTTKGVAVPLPTFKVPNRKEIAEHTKVVDELESMIAEIDAVLLRMESLNDVRTRKEKTSLSDYREHLDTALNEVLDALDVIVGNHRPEMLETMCKALFKHVNAILPADSYDNLEFADAAVTSHETFAGVRNAAIEFTNYLYVEGLDKEQFNIDRFILVLTGVVQEVAVYKETNAQGGIKKGVAEVNEDSKDDSKKYKKTNSYFRMALYMTSLNKFAMPGHFDPGIELSGSNISGLIRDMNKQASMLISAHSLAPIFNTIPINVPTQALRHSPLTNVNGVEDAVNENGTVLLKLSISNTKVINNDIWPDVLVALKATIGRKRRDANFVSKLERKGSTTYMRVTYVKG